MDVHDVGRRPLRQRLLAALLSALLAALLVPTTGLGQRALADEGDDANASRSSGTEVQASGLELLAEQGWDGLADGEYTVDIRIWQTNKNELSMADDAIGHTATLTVENGVYYLTLDFDKNYQDYQVSVSMEGYLGDLYYYESGFIVNERYGTISGTVTLAEILTYQTDENGELIVDQYNDPSNPDRIYDSYYPDLVKIELPSEVISGADEDGYSWAPVRVFVPVMESIAAGNGMQDCYVRIDWSTLELVSLAEGEGSGDTGAVSFVIAAIDAIGTVTTSDESAIRAARAAYSELSNDEKALVENYDDLVAAENALGQLLVMGLTDVYGHWVVGEGWLQKAMGRGLITGYLDGDGGPTGEFGPDDSLTRAQAATIIYRWANPASTDTTVAEDYAASSGVFSDLPAEPAYYTAAVEWCAAAGIVSGYDDAEGDPTGEFGPGDLVTREQLAKMLAELASYCGLDISADESALDGFPDASEASGFAVGYLAWCAESGLMSGYANTGELNPVGQATRAEAAKMIVRLMELVEG